MLKKTQSLSDYVKKIQNLEAKRSPKDIDSLIEETISKINFLIAVLIDEDVYQLENDAIGWVFVDVIKKNKLTQPEEIVKQVSSYNMDNIFVCSELKINKIDVIKELLKISLTTQKRILPLQKNYF